MRGKKFTAVIIFRPVHLHHIRLRWLLHCTTALMSIGAMAHMT